MLIKKDIGVSPNSLSPDSFLLPALTDEPHPTTSEKGIFVSRPTEGEHLKVVCVIFTDRCWEAGVSLQLQQKEGSISQSLCEMVTWLWSNWLVCSVLACNPICVKLCPSSALLPIKQSCCLILCGCPLKKPTEMRNKSDTVLSCCLSSFFLAGCLKLLVCYLTLLKPGFLSLSLIHVKAEVSLWKLGLLFNWLAFKLLPRQTFTFIWTLNPAVKSSKLALEVQ